TANADGKATFWVPGTGAAERSIEAGDKAATCIAVSRNLQLVAVGSADKKVRVFPYTQPKELSTFTAPVEPRALAFSPDNQARAAGVRSRQPGAGGGRRGRQRDGLGRGPGSWAAVAGGVRQAHPGVLARSGGERRSLPGRRVGVLHRRYRQDRAGVEGAIGVPD